MCCEMQKTIEVVYEKGVFKPLEKVEIPEGAKRRIRIGHFDFSFMLSYAKV